MDYMDYGKLVRRAWKIAWDNKYLWVLGLLAGLARLGNNGNSGDTSGGFGLPAGGQLPLPRLPGQPLPGMEMLEVESGALVGIFLGITCLMLLVGLIVWALAAIARGGLVGGVVAVEEDAEERSLGTAFGVGTGNAGRLIGVALLPLIPLALMWLVGVGATLPWLTADAETVGVSIALSPVLACTVPLFCALLLVAIGLRALRTFAERAVVLEGLSGMAAYRRGWTVLLENLGESVVLLIISFVIGVVVYVGWLFVAFLFGSPLIASFAAADRFDQAGLMMTMGVVGACLGLIFLVLSILLTAFVTTFESAMWTLAYRDFIKNMPPLPEPEPAEG